MVKRKEQIKKLNVMPAKRIFNFTRLARIPRDFPGFCERNKSKTMFLGVFGNGENGPD